MPSPCRVATKLRKVTLSKAPTISRKIPKGGFFQTRQCSTRRTNSCKAVSVATPARKPYCDAESFACTLLSSLYDTELAFPTISVEKKLSDHTASFPVWGEIHLCLLSMLMAHCCVSGMLKKWHGNILSVDSNLSVAVQDRARLALMLWMVEIR